MPSKEATTSTQVLPPSVLLCHLVEVAPVVVVTMVPTILNGFTL